LQKYKQYPRIIFDGRLKWKEQVDHAIKLKNTIKVIRKYCNQEELKTLQAILWGKSMAYPQSYIATKKEPYICLSKCPENLSS
jgi:hypothetical protein